ncbi:Hypothetical predicted protein [Octopus vulgaris]|uniref:Uncharacterized protein n=1 Tax=Octopus vulgaris TaxID=6645 RepID=A0AA36B2X7_OCTVU|nr:Hypothetical predicted protein [Octopus vulgaris]
MFNTCGIGWETTAATVSATIAKVSMKNTIIFGVVNAGLGISTGSGAVYAGVRDIIGGGAAVGAVDATAANIVSVVGAVIGNKRMSDSVAVGIVTNGDGTAAISVRVAPVAVIVGDSSLNAALVRCERRLNSAENATRIPHN